ncbi:MAG: exodeoxyribonuclease V subunit gamma, partial [Pseudohongiella sp.]|nr:exodeoxyribonuclease V subunit gamma [Pseudohongiella sp.]
VPAVQNAFDISTQDKPLLHRWIEQSGIRWGLNASHRESLGMSADLSTQALEQNTWHFGLRRMLLGYTMGRGDQQQGQSWQDIEAFDEIGGLSAALVGKLAHLLRQLEQTWIILREPAQVTEWTQRLSALLTHYFVADDDHDLMLITRVEKILRDWRDACSEAQFEDELRIEVVRDFVLEQLDVQPLTQRFLAGSVNFATLMPMRAIPFKHICLLGMNDGDYPRQVPSVDFDLMRQDYRPGDRSRRDDDRYLFLEALLSARDSLYISWAGRSIRDNSERPPSVLVAQLRDYLKDTHGAVLLKNITQEYPLQPFSRRYFDEHSDLYTYAAEWSPTFATPETARSSALVNHKTDSQEISLNDLEKLLRVPAEVFFEQRLGVNFSMEEVTTEDHEAFTVDGLALWGIQQQLLKEAVTQIKQADSIEDLLRDLMDKQVRRGSLPIPPFAEVFVKQTVQRLSRPLLLYRDMLIEHSQNVHVSVSLASEDKLLTLNDQLSDIWHMLGDPAQGIRCVLLNSQLWAGKDGKNAKVKWHYLARLWPAHLAAQLYGHVHTYIFGPDTSEVLAPLNKADAESQLIALLELWQKNLQAPLAACVKTSCAFLTTPDEKSPKFVAQEIYEGGFMVTGEVQQHYALYRLWPAFNLLNNSGFSDDSDALYGGLTEHWLRHRKSQSAGDAA